MPCRRTPASVIPRLRINVACKTKNENVYLICTERLRTDPAKEEGPKRLVPVRAYLVAKADTKEKSQETTHEPVKWTCSNCKSKNVWNKGECQVCKVSTVGLRFCSKCSYSVPKTTACPRCLTTAYLKPLQ